MTMASCDGSDDWFMQLAVAQAQLALEHDEVPVGAIIVRHERVIGAAFNQREQLKDPTAHAEMLAITQAASAIGDWRLGDCTLYVTLEPCAMCAGAIVLARLRRLVYGAADPKAGAVDSLYQLLQDVRLNHQVAVTSGVRSAECGELLTRYFQAKRLAGKK
jgi:tRNA(adenine34) deaminase